jgi:hypothetical protein
VTGTLGYLRHYPISHLQKSILSGKRDHISHKFPDEKSFVFSHKQVVYVVMASYHENALFPIKMFYHIRGMSFCLHCAGYREGSVSQMLPQSG